MKEEHFGLRVDQSISLELMKIFNTVYLAFWKWGLIVEGGL